MCSEETAFSGVRKEGCSGSAKSEQTGPCPTSRPRSEQEVREGNGPLGRLQGIGGFKEGHFQSKERNIPKSVRIVSIQLMTDR